MRPAPPFWYAAPVHPHGTPPPLYAGPAYRGGYREGRPPMAIASVLYAYAYLRDAIDIMTNTSDKYD